MVLGLSMRRSGTDYVVSGLLFDYFPRAEDPLLRLFTRDRLERH
jgi:hypothetical protein